MRKNNIENGYEIIKKYFRNNSIINKEKFEEIINDLVNTLNIKEEDKIKLKNLTNYNYIGNVNKK